MPLLLTVSCYSKIQIGFAFLVPTHPDSPTDNVNSMFNFKSGTLTCTGRQVFGHVYTLWVYKNGWPWRIVVTKEGGSICPTWCFAGAAFQCSTYRVIHNIAAYISLAHSGCVCVLLLTTLPVIFNWTATVIKRLLLDWYACVDCVLTTLCNCFMAL